MKRVLKSTLAVVLCIIMLVGVVPMGVFAQEDNLGATDCLNSDVTIKSTNSVGKLVSQALKTNELDTDTEYGVTGITMNDKTATVTGFAKESCVLVAALFDETTERMLASGIGEFKKDDNTASVEIDITTMPKYYIVRAFLLNENGKSLCDKFTNREHTQEFEEFYSATVDDFDDEKVINLDDDKTSNFVVLTETAISVKATDDSNKLVESDTEKGKYVFENINSEITSLKAGDLFYSIQDDEQDVLIIKIKSINIDGTTATIIETDTELSEVFDYVKIEGTSVNKKTEVDMSQADEGVEHRQIEENQEQLTTNALDYNDSKSFSDEFTIKEKEITKNVKLSLTFTIKLKANVKVYYAHWFKKDYVDISMELTPSVDLTFSISGEIEKNIVKLGSIDFSVCPGVLVGFSPEFVVKVSGKLSISGKVEAGKLAYSYNSDEGFKNNSTPFKFEPEIEIEVTIFVGINMKPHIAILHEKVAEASLNGEIGFEIKATSDVIETLSNDNKHDCSFCVDGDISFVITFSVEIKLLNSEKMTLKADLWSTSFKIADFYISIPYGFNWGECNHKYNKVSFVIADSESRSEYEAYAIIGGIFSGVVSQSFKSGIDTYIDLKDSYFDIQTSALVKNATVSGNNNSRYYPNENGDWDGNTATASEGKATLYFTTGEQTAVITANGYKSKTVNFTITDEEKSLLVFMEKGADPTEQDEPGSSDGTGSADNFSNIGTQGGIIQFGSYPQTDVTSSMGTTLNSKASGWKSYKYYEGTGSYGTMHESDYMYYCDVTYGNNKYRGVKFNTYRPYRTKNASTTSCSTYQDDNGYTVGNTYWFKYEPLKWRVLDPSNGIVMSESIIDSQAYNNYIWCGVGSKKTGSQYYGDEAHTKYASNYSTSSLRKWLNENFYATAFSEAQQKKMSAYECDNSCYSSSYPEYNSDPLKTNDKVFLLSYNEVTNTAYGFNSSASNYDTARFGKGSDYAKCQGLYVYKNSGSVYDGNSSWWLRSPISNSDGACSVSDLGYCNYYYFVDNTYVGVRPALKLNLKSLSTQSTDTAKSYKDGTGYGYECTAGVAGGEYMLLNVTGYGNEFTLTTENLEYIDQITADENGKISGKFIPRKAYENSTTLLIGDFGKGTEVKVLNASVDEKDKPAEQMADVEIYNYKSGMTVDYKSTLTFTTTYSVPSGYKLVWSNGQTGNTCTYTKVTDNQITVYVQLVKISDNSVAKQSKEQIVTIKTGFFAKLAAFFRGLFGTLPVYVDNKKS